MNKKQFTSVMCVVIMCISSQLVNAQKKFKPTWESLQGYEIPEWFKDAKFGIFIHWGPTTVPAHGPAEWYGFQMWNEGVVDALGNPEKKPSSSYKYHVENFGKPEDFGYTKFIPMFKAENFDAKKWIDLFEQAGAKYIVPVGEHCDGFAMYNSKVTRWNSVDMGPKKDIVGELFKEARSRALKVGVSSHFAYGWHWWTYKDKFETTDPKLKDFYWDKHKRWEPASRSYVKHFYKRTSDLMSQYKPDLLWFDLGFSEPAYESTRKKIFAEFYNQGIKNKQEVVLNYKNIRYKGAPDGTAVLDIESGKLDRIRKEAWQTDMSLGGYRWGYTNDYQMREAGAYINDLIDIVSKNGCLLLNVAPNKHGEIPLPQQDILKEIGAWLKVNGEGIYETRPFEVFGQGPTNASMKLHGNSHDKGFTPDDFRYTQKGQNVYAFWLKKDDRKVVTLDALGAEDRILNDAILDVRLLGFDKSIKWIQQKNELVIELPKDYKSDNAVCFKIRLKEKPSDILGDQKSRKDF
ncbi:alpha-L-fucosidase [Wenyingzhuangia heitensis]|uniref:alpha-L-fucosidase n=1 Tax=Wenyingzhuangia heitensis TaxID=1487859 RepID=A0ABX0UDH6_9FLAO|nr:alpha-L-fucosidase [Wenyingzhuangia heitensis]NIJ46458.1 alpha-L-fucosidase [Wenyingzhuangia heitensis]